MQNIDLICVGKLNAKYFAEGVAEYQKRLAAFASFRIIELPEEKIEEKNASDAVVKKALDKEGRAILSNVRKGSAIVAMCIEGRQISSDELAQFLADRANSGAGDVAFVIGSSHGLSDEVKKAAALKFSMGMVWVPCDRCLDDMELPISSSDKLMVKFGHEYAEEGENLIVIPEEEGEINVAWFMYEFIALSIPMKHVHAPGKCNKAMTSKLSKHLKTNANEDSDEVFDTGGDDIVIEEEVEEQIDPRWNELKKILDNN